MSAITKGRILIVDDEVELLRALTESLAGDAFDCIGKSTPEEALQTLREDNFDLLLTDLMMPGMNGIELWKVALTIDPNLVGIIMTGQGTISTAVEAMKVGALDYILKPFKMPVIRPILQRAMEVRRLKMENVRLRRIVEHIGFESSRYHMIGSGPAMRKVMQMIEKVAPTDATVLIRGASGSGKELVARALHHNSARRDQPLVTINCAALQETLLESELFGHEKGAFTGAVQTKRGLYEIAEGGTLFIDEIAEMAPGMQAKLLRLLENGHYRRVGGTQELQGNVRIIAATNKPLEEEQQKGRFREDLFYRLNVFTINLPALRDRREDIPELVEHFLATRQLGKIRSRIHPDAMAKLVQYDWPGNIRELANVIERAQILATENLITLDDLPENLTVGTATKAMTVSTSSVADSTNHGAIVPTVIGSDDLLELDEVEKRHVQRVLALKKGNKVHTARALGISRRALYRVLKRHGLLVARKSQETAPSETQ